MSEHGIYLYDLAENFCEECGRAKIGRLGPVTGCKTCDEVRTRHRCTKRPAMADRAPGQEWDCPDCGSIWKLAEEEDSCPDCCHDCGHTVVTRRWVLAEEGDRMDSAPRYEPPPLFTPFRKFAPTSALPPPGMVPNSCYRLSNGSMVHVKPGCRCR